MRPTAVGYLSVAVRPSTGDGPPCLDEAVYASCRELAAFATAEGYALVATFMDARHHTDRGLYALLEVLRRGEAAAVVVPHLDDLRHVGCLVGTDLRAASRYLRARLLTMRPDDTVPQPTTVHRSAERDHRRARRVDAEPDRWARSAALVLGARR